MPIAPNKCPAALPTPVIVQKLAKYLDDYPKEQRDFLLEGFSVGFSIRFEGDRSGYDSKNLTSALDNEHVVDRKLDKELAAGRIAGPFNSIPFADFKCSPLGVVPKKSPNEFRLIHHLSFAPGEADTSVNQGIPREEATVQYEGIDDAVHLLKQLGPKAFMAKSDVRNAFRILPVHPRDYPLLGFKWRGKYYYDLSMPMGCSIACKVFEALSSALQWILRTKFGVSRVVKVLDDFLFIESSRQLCNKSLYTFLALCKELGVPIANEKTMGPSEIMVFLGVELDSVKMELRLPLDKISRCREQLNQLRVRRKVTLREMQSLIGLLNFACVAIPGRAFLRRLITLTIGVRRPHHYISLNKEARADMLCWLQFLDQFNGKTMFIEEAWVSSNTIHLFTDAAGGPCGGYGAYLGSRYFYGAFPASWTSYNIVFLELYPIVVAVHVWGSLLKNHSILFFTDNEALCYIINKQSSKEPTVMVGIRRLVTACLGFNIRFHAKHLSSQANAAADALSRFQVTKFKQLMPDCQDRPTRVPEHLLPDNFFKPLKCLPWLQ